LNEQEESSNWLLMLVAFLLPIITMFIAVPFNVFGKGYEVLLSLSIIVSIIISIYDSVRRKKLKLGFVVKTPLTLTTNYYFPLAHSMIQFGSFE
jgi:hypothetical protein